MSYQGPGQQWQPAQYDPSAHQQPMGQHQPVPYTPQAPAAPAVRPGLTAAQKFWYILGCIPLGAAYFAKVPAKKAMHDFGMCDLTGAEAFWYVLMNILPPFGGYFAKLTVAKALSEVPQFRG